MKKINNLNPRRPVSQETGFKAKAFTLVELIVVITILAILATIGFVSFSWYLAWTRDTNRVAQLKAMSDALELYSTKDDLPKTDNYIEVKDWDNIIAYQGYIWKDVLETIWYTESWLDPKDKTYFSYYLTKNKKYFQLMAFLEEKDKDVVALNNFDKANAIDYSIRYPKTTGKKLWMLTDKDNTPLQELTWSIDISNVWDLELKSFLKWNDYLSWTGTTFAPLKTFAEKWGKFCASENKKCIRTLVPNGLIAYYLLTSNTKDELWDIDGIANNWIIFNWESAIFDGVDDNITFFIWKEKFNNEISFVFTLNTNDWSWDREIISNDESWYFINIKDGASIYDAQLFETSKNYNRIFEGEEWEYDLENNKDYHFIISYKSWNSNVYINWKKWAHETEEWNSSLQRNISSLGYWDDFPYKGSMKNVRIYNRALTEEEIKIIYNEEK